jgi:drug/metabolite transporter superfamily protein YnfA
MTLDVRRPLGWLFLLLGLILTAYGWLSTHVGGSQPQPNDYLNGLWGGIFVLFGLVVLWISRRTPAR